MTLKHSMKGSALAALAAAMAVAIIPVEALALPPQEHGASQDRDDPRQRTQQRRQERRAVQQRADVQRARDVAQVREQSRQRAQAQREQAQRAQQERVERARASRSEARQERDRNRGDAGVDRQRSEIERRLREGREQIERNRTYTDPNRDRTYGGRHEDDDWRDRGRDRDRDRGDWRDRDDRDGDRWRDRDRDRGDWRGRDSGRDYRGAQRWDRRWRHNDRYNWHRYRTYNRNIFNLGRYYSPYRDYRYSRLSIGIRLGSSFYGNRYWINDPYRYRLPEVYGPYRWVRYYDDVLLVNTYTGEVVDVIYDFFW